MDPDHFLMIGIFGGVSFVGRWLFSRIGKLEKKLETCEIDHAAMRVRVAIVEAQLNIVCRHAKKSDADT